MNRPTTSHLQAYQASVLLLAHSAFVPTKHGTFSWNLRGWSCRVPGSGLANIRSWSASPSATVEELDWRETRSSFQPHSVACEQPRPHDHYQQQLITTTSLFETCGSEVSAPRSLRAPGSSTYIEYMAGKQGKHPKVSKWRTNYGGLTWSIEVGMMWIILDWYKHTSSIWFIRFGRHFRILDINLPRLGKYKPRTDVQCTSCY